MNEKYEVLDSCYGEIEGRCIKGAFLKLDNGERAFAYKYSNLRTGTKVICTVLRQAKENRLKLVSVDTVTEYAV